jgi:uncharacterized protein
MTETHLIDVTIQSGNETLRGDMLSGGPGLPMVVLCHGIPLSRPDPSDPGYALLARALAEAGFAALFVNFRGCGTSSGDFYLGGWYKDLCSIMDFARGEVSPRKLFIAGFSAGGALGIKYVAEHGGVDGLAAFAAPARLSGIFGRDQLMQLLEAARDIRIIKDRDFPPTPDWFYRDLQENEAVDYVSRVSPVPLLIVHGDGDELVPVAQAKELFAAAHDPKELVMLPGGEHRLRHDPRSMELLLDWLRQL